MYSIFMIRFFMVEQLTVNQLVVGSIPTAGAIYLFLKSMFYSDLGMNKPSLNSSQGNKWGNTDAFYHS